MSTRWNLHSGATAMNNKLRIPEGGLMKVAVGLFIWTIALSASADGSGKWKDGKEAYDSVCAYCHETGVGPVIRSQGAPKEWRDIVRKGLRAMPPFRTSEIDDATLAQLMEYIK